MKEAELMELVANGEIAYDELEKYRTLYESRTSQLGDYCSRHLAVIFSDLLLCRRNAVVGYYQEGHRAGLSSAHCLAADTILSEQQRSRIHDKYAAGVLT
jgi:hypothetical protein